MGRELARSRTAGLVPAQTSVSAPAPAPVEARREVLGVLADLGFDPADSRDEVVLLSRCPLLDVARRYPEVVCQVHRGWSAVPCWSAAVTTPGWNSCPSPSRRAAG